MLNNEQRRKIAEYARERNSLSPDEREKRFLEIAEMIGVKPSPASIEAEVSDRQTPIALPYPDNMPAKQIEAILKDPRTQEILNDPNNW